MDIIIFLLPLICHYDIFRYSHTTTKFTDHKSLNSVLQILIGCLLISSTMYNCFNMLLYSFYCFIIEWLFCLSTEIHNKSYLIHHLIVSYVILYIYFLGDEYWVKQCGYVAIILEIGTLARNLTYVRYQAYKDFTYYFWIIMRLVIFPIYFFNLRYNPITFLMAIIMMLVQIYWVTARYFKLITV